MTLIEKLEKLLSVPGASHPRLAALLSISETTMHRWRRGDNTIPKDKQARILELFAEVENNPSLLYSLQPHTLPSSPSSISLPDWKPEYASFIDPKGPYLLADPGWVFATKPNSPRMPLPSCLHPSHLKHYTLQPKTYSTHVPGPVASFPPEHLQSLWRLLSTTSPAGGQEWPKALVLAEILSCTDTEADEQLSTGVLPLLSYVMLCRHAAVHTRDKALVAPGDFTPWQDLPHQYADMRKTGLAWMTDDPD